MRPLALLVLAHLAALVAAAEAKGGAAGAGLGDDVLGLIVFKADVSYLTAATRRGARTTSGPAPRTELPVTRACRVSTLSLAGFGPSGKLDPLCFLIKYHFNVSI